VHHPAVLINHHDLARDSLLDEVADLAAQTLVQDSSAVRQSLRQTFCFISEAPIPAAAGPRSVQEITHACRRQDGVSFAAAVS
jgi:hypothetical protein